MRSLKARPKRPYRLGKRADAAARTRRRIVEATIEVHDERGISRTSIRDVAERAKVSPATVLNHFPRMADLIRACGELTSELLPMPTPDVLVGARNRAEAVRLAARALFAWWEALGPGWDHLQVDRRTIPDVDAWLRDVEHRRRELVRTALGPHPRAGEAVLAALTSRGAWLSFRESGLDPDRAAAEVAAVYRSMKGNLH